MTKSRIQGLEALVRSELSGRRMLAPDIIGFLERQPGVAVLEGTFGAANSCTFKIRADGVEGSLTFPRPRHRPW